MGARAGEGTIPVSIRFDLEPDGPGFAPTGTWDGVAATRAWVEEIRERAGEVTGRPVRVSWMVRCDPQVADLFGSATYVVDQNPDLFAEIERRGDEVGLHIHGWRRSGDGDRWVDDYRDEAWFDHCIDHAFAGYEAALGRPCRLVSFGYRFLGDAAVARLVHHGTRIDVTGEPGNAAVEDGDWDDLLGRVPDQRHMPRRPHELAPNLVELPQTAGPRRLGLAPRAHLSRMRHHGVRERLVQPLPLWGRDRPGPAWGELIAASIRRQRRPYLSFAVRSDGILDEVQRPRLLGHLDELFALPEAHRFAFLTPTETIEAVGVQRRRGRGLRPAGAAAYR